MPSNKRYIPSKESEIVIEYDHHCHPVRAELCQTNGDFKNCTKVSRFNCPLRRQQNFQKEPPVKTNDKAFDIKVSDAKLLDPRPLSCEDATHKNLCDMFKDFSFGKELDFKNKLPRVQGIIKE